MISGGRLAALWLVAGLCSLLLLFGILWLSLSGPRARGEALRLSELYRECNAYLSGIRGVNQDDAASFCGALHRGWEPSDPLIGKIGVLHAGPMPEEEFHAQFLCFGEHQIPPEVRALEKEEGG